MAFKPEYLSCVPSFDGNANDLNRYLTTCDSLITAFYDQNDPNKFENIYLINSLIGKLVGTAKVVVNIQNVSTWEDLKNTLIRNFADQRDEACLNRDLVMLRQQPNESPNQFYDRVLYILNLLCSYVDNHEQTDSAKILKRNLYTDLALKTFLSGLKEHLGTNIRCMRPSSLAAALQFVNEEYNNQYFQNYSKATKPPTLNTRPTNATNAPFNFNNQTRHDYSARPNFGSNIPHNFNSHTPNDFFRRQNHFPTQPINIQPRPNPQQRYFTNSQVFGRPQNQNVFRPNQNKPLPNPTPMSTTTRNTSNNFRKPSNNFNQPSTARPNYFQSFPQQPRNFTFEELHNTEQYGENSDEFCEYLEQETENNDTPKEDTLFDQDQNSEFGQETEQNFSNLPLQDDP